MKINDNRSNYRSQAEADADQQRNYKLKFFLLLAGLIGCLLFLVFFQIYHYVQLSRKNLHLEKLKEKRSRLKTETAHLRLEVSQLRSLERIENKASQQLGMQEATEVNYLVVDDYLDAKQDLKPKGSKQDKEPNNWWNLFGLIN